MKTVRVLVQPREAEVVRRLAPDPKKRVRAVLNALQDDPRLGEPLIGDLLGLWKVPVGQYRVVYRSRRRLVEIVSVGPRETIYIDLIRERRARGKG
ncbi:MAG: hypothetical protein A2082_00365 [Chloroflexi bacterium GWC2_70_10]|nr:MAG: hypothetical protein A2082_00365 [Chloroflexi bacterium GWC2_70_10]